MDRTKTKVCAHGRNRMSNCKWCSPHLQCEHNRLRRRCVACTGGCEHGKKPNACMHCNPNLMCKHSLWKYSCKLCNTPKLKNTAAFMKVPAVPQPKIIRVKTRVKANDQFMKAVRYCTAPDGEDATRAGAAPEAGADPQDQQASSLLSYDMQRELVQSLWRDTV